MRVKQGMRKATRRLLATLAAWPARVLWPALAAGAALVLWPASTAAEPAALLVGVSRVDSLPRRLWLRGPDHDVEAMRQALLQRGFAAPQVVVLAERAPSASARPTRAAIEGALQAMLAHIRPGDPVVLHFAGHGVQLPQAAGKLPPEPDGLDEAFLTADTRPWDAEAGRLPGALLDGDIGRWIDTLVDRGARVFAVFDSCHSAGLSRSDGGRTRVRSVAAAELGVPAVLPAPPTPPTRPRVRAAASPAALHPARTDGRVLAHAARAHEATTEEWLPRGAHPARTRLQGVFSHAVVQALADGATTAEALRESLAQQYRREGRLAPVPQVRGVGGLLGP